MNPIEANIIPPVTQPIYFLENITNRGSEYSLERLRACGPVA